MLLLIAKPAGINVVNIDGELQADFALNPEMLAREFPFSKLNGKKVAIELNGKILPQNKHNTSKLKNNDIIEIVQFIGGG